MAAKTLWKVHTSLSTQTDTAADSRPTTIGLFNTQQNPQNILFKYSVTLSVSGKQHRSMKTTSKHVLEYLGIDA
jgi:hypothetical protein